MGELTFKATPKTKTVHIDATVDDLAVARKNPNNCFVATAIRRQIPSLAYVGIDNASFFVDGRYFPVPLDYTTRRVTGRFDAGLECQPFSFDLEVPVEVLGG